jgi:hypothetical protein
MNLLGTCDLFHQIVTITKVNRRNISNEWTIHTILYEYIYIIKEVLDLIVFFVIHDRFLRFHIYFMYLSIDIFWSNKIVVVFEVCWNYERPLFSSFFIGPPIQTAIPSTIHHLSKRKDRSGIDSFDRSYLILHMIKRGNSLISCLHFRFYYAVNY